MLILIANINGSKGLEEIESAAINTEIKKLGLDLPVKVFSEHNLLKALDNMKDECILFTNFPPDSSYSKSVKGSYYSRSWNAYSYEISHGLFSKIADNYSLKAIHFLTGAPESMVSDKMLFYFSSPETIVTVTRRNQLMAKVNEYPRMYRQFIIKKLKESLDI